MNPPIQPAPVQNAGSNVGSADNSSETAAAKPAPAAPLTAQEPQGEAGIPPVSPAGLTQQPAARQYSPTIYSHNSKQVRSSRRNNMLGYLLTILLVVFIIAAGLLYWLSIGSPSRIEDIPLVRSLLAS